jgi:hypothetical protein
VAVSTDEFEALTPVPYSVARAQLRTGDILLFHSLNIGSVVIEHFTHSLWSHAAFIWNMEDIDRVLLLESVDTFGVRALSLRNRINGSSAAPEPYPGKLLVLRHPDFPYPADPRKIGLMTQFAIDRLGYPYATAELVKIGMRIAAGLAGMTLPGELQPENAYVCSEYVANCYKAMGIALAPDKGGFIAPADIAEDPKVQAVLALCPDPPGATTS